MRLWQWCCKHHHGVGKVLAKDRTTSETQQGEIDHSVRTSLYHPARLPLCPAYFGVATNYIVSGFIRFWHRNRRHSWPVGQWRSEGMLGRILKVEKKVRRSVVRTLLGRLWLFGNRKNRLLFGRLWNAVIKWNRSTAKKLPSYSDYGTLSPLVHCSTDQWTIAYRTQLTTISVWKYFW